MRTEWQKCTCGVDKTYGRDAKPHMHSDYCDKYRKEKPKKTCSCDAERKYGKGVSRIMHEFGCDMLELEDE